MEERGRTGRGRTAGASVHPRTGPRRTAPRWGRCAVYDDGALAARALGDALAEAALGLAASEAEKAAAERAREGPAAEEPAAADPAVRDPAVGEPPADSGPASEARRASPELPGLDGQGGRALALLGPLLKAAGAALPAEAPDGVRAWFDAPCDYPGASAVGKARLALDADDPELAFARAYERLVRAADRRLLGTYFTPPPVVAFMTGRLAEALPAPSVVVDAGAGVGALTLAARRAWPDAAVVAVDVNPASLGLLAVAAASSATPGRGALSLVLEDYLVWSGRWATLPGRRALLANPPYTRHQARTAQEKDAATKAAGDLMPHRTGSLSSYMLAATWWRLGRDDALALVLPDNWLHAAYAKGLRQAIWASRDRRVDLYAMPEDESVFPDARVRAMVLVVWPAAATGEPVRVHRTSRADDGLTAEIAVQDRSRHHGGDALKDLWRTGIAADDAGQGRTGSSAPAEDGPAGPARPDRRAAGGAGGPSGRSAPRRPLSDVVRLRRGIATGSNKTFLLRQSDVAGIPADRLRPAVHRLASVRGAALTAAGHRRLVANGQPAWLLDARDDDPDQAVQELLDAARRAGVPTRVLCGRRHEWCALEFPDEPPEVLVSPSTSGDARFTVVRNEAEAHITNNLLGAHARSGTRLSAAQWKRLAAWLADDDAQGQWRRLARVHSGGLRKLEPRAARSILLPAWLADDLSKTVAPAREGVAPGRRTGN